MSELQQMDELPDCCFVAIFDITHPVLAQSVVCSKTHRVTWIGQDQGWHSTAAPRKNYSPKRPKDLTSQAGPYSSNDVVRICETSYRKLDYWVHQGWVESVQVMTPKGWSRRFTPQALRRVHELERASKFKASPLPVIAAELKEFFDWKRKSRSTEDVPTQGVLL